MFKNIKHMFKYEPETYESKFELIISHHGSNDTIIVLGHPLKLYFIVCIHQISVK